MTSVLEALKLLFRKRISLVKLSRISKTYIIVTHDKFDFLLSNILYFVYRLVIKCNIPCVSYLAVELKVHPLVHCFRETCHRHTGLIRGFGTNDKHSRRRLLLV